MENELALVLDGIRVLLLALASLRSKRTSPKRRIGRSKRKRLLRELLDLLLRLVSLVLAI